MSSSTAKSKSEHNSSSSRRYTRRSSRAAAVAHDMLCSASLIHLTDHPAHTHTLTLLSSTAVRLSGVGILSRAVLSAVGQTSVKLLLF